MTLLDVVKNGRSDVARVSAENVLLNRFCGEPATKEEIKHVDLSPVVIKVWELVVETNR